MSKATVRTGGRRVRAPSDSRPPGQSVAAPHASRCVKAGTARARPRRYSSYFGEGISCRTSFLKGACRTSLGALLGTCRHWPFRLSAASVTRQLHRTKAPGFLTPLASLSRRFGAIAAHCRTWPTPNAACGRAESSSLSATGIPHEPDPWKSLPLYRFAPPGAGVATPGRTTFSNTP